MSLSMNKIEICLCINNVHNTKMAKSCGSKGHIFQEAINHCRWKTVLRKNILTQPELQEHNLHQFSGKSFDEILSFVYDKKVTGVGMLIIYDICAAICRYNKIPIKKIYIIGDGPKRAIRILNIKAKTHIIKNIKLKYIEIPELLKAFEEQHYAMDEHVKHSDSGDDFETYICNWQKIYA